METQGRILDGGVPEAEFAASNGISPRTVKRYRNEPNGLPWLEFGGRVYIPLEAAKEWLDGLIRRPNQRRRAA